jgi:hypothetical protein
MAVEDSQAPGRQHQESRTGKENPYQADGDLALLSRETRRNDRDERRGHQYPQQYQHRSGKGQQTEYRPRDPASFPRLVPRQQPGVHRDKRGGKHPFTEEILEEVRDPERRIECIRGIRGPEVMGEYPVANQAENTAQQDPGGNNRRGPSRPGGQGPGGGGRVAR